MTTAPTESRQASLLVDCKNLLGECIQWHVDQQRLFWTDVNSSTLHSCRADGSELTTLSLPEPLGSFAFEPAGSLLAAFASGLFRLDLRTRQRERLTHFEPELPATRLNDGRCDRQGRFIVGGCHQGFYNPVSSVIRYDGGRASHTLIEKVALTNGLAFSTDGTTLYFSDSETRRYMAYDYDPQTGDLGAARLFATIEEGEGFADGSCVDSQDHLFNARYYAGFVQEYLPNGSLGMRIHLPTLCPTCVCFGGPALDTLFISTGRNDLTDEQLSAQPGAGGVFAVKLPRTGLAENQILATG